MRARCREHGAVPRVEERTVFEQAHRFGDGIERAAAVGENALAGDEDAIERRVILRFGFGAQ